MNESIVSQLRSRRLELDLSQREVAFKINSTPQYISLIELGQANITLETLFKLCDVLSLEIKLEKV